MYLIEGDVKVGEEEKKLDKDQVGWLNLSKAAGQSELKLTAGETGVSLVLYAGKPTGDKIVSQGPFIADTTEDI